MHQTEFRSHCAPSAALRRWVELAENHDVYIELDFGFAGVIGDPDGLPPRLARRLDEWMQNLIRQCRDKEKADRWLRLKLTQRGHVLHMECEASGCPPDPGGLRNAGAYLETQDMGESFWLKLEAGLTARPQNNNALSIRPQ